MPAVDMGQPPSWARISPIPDSSLWPWFFISLAPYLGQNFVGVIPLQESCTVANLLRNIQLCCKAPPF
jgi:hypothetical protein